MNIGAMLQSAIYIISSSMLYPAMFLLAGGFAAAVAGAGAAISEWTERRAAIRDGGTRAAVESRFAETLKELDELLAAPGASWNEVERLWRAARLNCWKKLDYLRILARLGPAMGLVGTLIPMSAGLASLSQGDTSRLSSDLVIAFSTTVVGLCSGVAAYVLYTIRSRWLEGGLQELQLLMESRAARRFAKEGKAK